MTTRSVFAAGAFEALPTREVDKQIAPVELYGGSVVPLEQAAERNDVSPIIRRFGTWAVTEYGVECLISYYAIPKERLDEDDWLYHLCGKAGDRGWADYWDVWSALRFGRKYFKTPRRKPVEPTQAPEPTMIARERHTARRKLSHRVRFLVMKRDGYRCQFCGRMANDGVQLDIDHIVPRAKGGSDRADNLQVLCSPCNNGKRTDEQ